MVNMTYGITFGDERQSIAQTGYNFATIEDAIRVAQQRLRGEIAFRYRDDDEPATDLLVDAFPGYDGESTPTVAWIETTDDTVATAWADEVDRYTVEEATS